MINLHKIFLPVVANEILIQNISTKNKPQECKRRRIVRVDNC